MIIQIKLSRIVQFIFFILKMVCINGLLFISVFQKIKNFRFITITSYIQYTPMINLAAKYYGVSSNSIIWISNIF